MRRTLSVVAVAVIAALASGCWQGPAVLQGTVVGFDPATKVVVVRDEAGGAEVSFEVSGAEIGADPVAGDTVRLAYREKDGRKVASRLMNITRQAEIGKGSGH